jgi:GR25 family glycosyltransferase involved in LPS biosynthesis
MEINIIYINLDRSQERKKKFEDIINQVNNNLLKFNSKINLFRQQAIDGLNEDNLFKFVDFKYDLTNFELGLTISHLLAIKTAFEKKLEFCLICEDDNIVVIDELYNLFTNNFLNKPQDIECWQLTVSDEKNFYESKNSAFNEWYNGLFNSGGYIIFNNGIEKLTNKYFKKEKIDLSSFPDRKMSDFLIFGSLKTYTSAIPFILSPPTPSLIHSDHDENHKKMYKKQYEKYLSIKKFILK